MSGMAEPPAPPLKADPETLVLRARPAPVTRFRRGMVIALAAATSAAIVGVAWFALRPATFSLVASGDDRPLAAAAPPPDLLTGVPASYGDVPRLGPPLPGDLGRPILNHQRESGALPDDRPGDAQRAAQEAEADRQRLAAERKSARESGVMVQLAGSVRSEAAPAPVPLAPPEGNPLAGEATSDADSRRSQLGPTARADAAGNINPHILSPAPSPFMLSAGSIIAASLITGLNSDLPGLVTAQVTEHVYDSVTGGTLLIPQGSRLIGSYDNVVTFGQRRALVVWQRIILPDGASIRIDNVPATDIQGHAGLSDRIDRHSGQLLKGVALSTLLGVGTELTFGGTESDLVRAIRQSAQQSGSRAGDQLVLRNLDVQPTLRVRPGWPLRVVVHQDIVMPPWRGTGS